MPGYYVHLAACNKEARKNRSFVCGVEVPDLLKKYYQLYGLEGTKVRYNLIKTPEMPEFKVLSPRVQQLENYLGQDGMYYGWSSSPDYRCFLNNLSHDDKNNPFYRGYLYHLLTDLLMYSYLDIESKFADFKMKHKNDENLLTLLNKEYDKLHNDWDKTNAIIRNTYKDVELTHEVEELGIVNFIQSDKTEYIDLDIILFLIDGLRKLNPINDNIDEMINYIEFLLSSKDTIKTATLVKK